jgi:hypothetical protein
MTHRRRQVLEHLCERDTPPTWAEIARRCGLYDYRAAKRIARDLKKMGAII